MGLYDSWLDFRDKCLTSPRFHEFALRFALTRPVVRKRQAEVFDVVSGFVYSQVLAACVEFELLGWNGLRSPGATVCEVAGFTGLDEDAALRLVRAASSLRLLEERDHRFRLGDLGAALSINEGALAMIRHHRHLYRDMTDPVAMLKSGRGETHLSRFWEYARSDNPAASDANAVSAYSELMSASQRDVAHEVVATFDFKPFRHLMDVGGGQGTFISHVAEAAPHLRFALFDLPEVVERAKVAHETRSFFPRVDYHGGSFFDNNLPTGADIISLVRILHDHDDEPVRQILVRVFAALDKGGTILVAEPMSTGGHAARISDAYFNFYLHAMGSGRPRKPGELISMLEEAGFSMCRVRKTRSPFTASVITAIKA